MTSRDFCYWLQGYFELGGGRDGLDASATQVIRNHLNLVFVHDIDGPDPDGKLQATHDGKPATPVKPNPLASRPPGARC